MNKPGAPHPFTAKQALDSFSPPHTKASFGLLLISHLARWAFIMGAVGLVVGYGLIFSFAQEPDGDSTALALFEAQYGQGLRYRVGESFWFNGAGALLAWGMLYFFLDSLTPKQYFLRRSQQVALDSSQQSNTSSAGVSRWLWTPFFWLCLLIIWAGWGWNQTRGWQGELYLEPGVEKLLGVDQKPAIMFERFLLPPAPDGEGRALLLRLLVTGQPYEIAVSSPYKGASWTLTPRWYGAILKAKDLVQPFFFGASGASEGLLRDGREVRVTVNVEALTVSSTPPLQEVTLTHYAILYARFAPGDGLLRLGTVMLMLLLLYCLWQGVLGIIKKN